MGEWDTCLLEDLAEVQTGPFGSQLHASDYVETGIPSIMPTNIGQRLEISREGIAYIRDEDAQRLSRYLVHAGDIVYSRRGDVEKCAYITSDEDGWLCGTGCLRVRFSSRKAVPRFYAYFLSTPEMREWVVGHAVGTTMPNLNTSILGKMPVVLPSIPEQEAIAEALGALDDKIRLLQRQNKTLESLAGIAFRKAFQNPEIQDEQVRLDHFVEVNPLRSLPRGSTVPYLEMSNVRTDVFHPDSWYDREFSSGTKFQNGDTLLARITPCLENGKTCFVNFLGEGVVAWGSTEYIVLSAKPILNPFFSYALAKNSAFRDFAIGCMSGSSGRQRVEITHLIGYELGMPSSSEIEEFNATLDPIVPKLKANFEQIRTLTETRDNLLPKLMSGEVRVKNG